MAFPSDPLGLRVELGLGNEWEDITGDVLTSEGIEHRRGLADMASAVDPSETRLTLRNTSGRYSPRNPLSPLYGQIGRNTPLRVSLHAGESYLRLPGSYASAYTSSATNVVGDLDVRADVELESWQARAGSLIELAGKYNTSGNQRSWLLAIGQRTIVLWWSPDGTTTMQVASAPLPLTGRRMAVRAVLDRDNGAAGNTVTFYTAPTIDGPWTQHGSPVVTAGTTGIFASTTALEVGGVGGIAWENATGRMYACQVRDGATLIANADFRGLTPGATTWTDTVGRTWTTWAAAVIDNRRTVGLGEVSAWPQRWEPSETHATTEVTAFGVLRRYRQGTKALESALRRRIPASNPLAYWPMEDAGGQAYSPIPGVRPLRLTQASWADDDSLPASGPLPTLPSSGDLAKLTAYVPSPTGSLTEWSVRMLYRCPQGPTAARRTMLRIHSTGTIRTWWIQQGAATLGSRVYATNDDEDVVLDSSWATGDNLWGQWIQITFSVRQTATSTVTWQLTWTAVGGEAGVANGTVSGKIGRPSRLTSPPDGYSTDLGGMAIGHLSVWPTAATTAYSRAVVGWTGETAGERMLRLAEEETLPLQVTGVVAEQEQVGPQRPLPWLSLLEEAAAVDGGLLCEQRDSMGLLYRDRAALYNQTLALTVDYRQLTQPFEPVEDDWALRNDVTVTREGGSSGRAVLEEGPLSVLPPPEGAGRYDTSVTLNLNTDDQADRIAWWMMHLGTWDEARYPQVTLRLHRHPELIPAVLALREGDRIRVTGLPRWVAPGDVDLLVMGLRHDLSDFRWLVTFQCQPAGPWTVGVVEDPALGRVDTDGTELSAPVGASSSVLPARVTAGPGWITAPAPVAFDRFAREVSGGWGTAELGQLWTCTGGPAADHRVSGGAGQHVCTTSGTYRISTLPTALADVDVRVRVTVPVAPTGDGIYLYVLARYASESSFYFARLYVGTDSTAVLSLRKRIPAESTLTASTVTLPHAAGRSYWVRISTQGTTVRAKAWTDGTAEPSAWQLTATDTSITAAGAAGVRSYIGPAITTPLPVTLSWDDFSARPYSTSQFVGEFPWDVRLGGEVCTVLGISGDAVSDSFGREVTDGWGSTDTGQPWAISGGTSATFSVASGAGQHQIPTADGANRFSLLPALSAADMSLAVSVATSAVATGTQGHQAYIVARYLDGANYYGARLEFATTGRVVLTLIKNVANTPTAWTMYDTGIVYSPGVPVRVRLEVQGSTLRARCWLASAAEPGTWQVTQTDTSLAAAGQVGVRTRILAGNTNTLPVTLSFSNWEQAQTMTVLRSVNGVSKTHTTGTPVSLANPTIVAL